MRVGLIHYRAGLMDGVSLEMEKWRKVLSRMGHSVEIIAGNNAPGVDIVIPEIEYNDEKNEILNSKLYGRTTSSESELLDELSTRTAEMLGSFRSVLSDFDLLIPNNIWSLGWSIPAGLALHDYAEETKKPFISHNHDFWWDRPYYSSPYRGIMELLQDYFPPDLENVRNLTINSISASDLRRRRAIRAEVVPNVMDFRQSDWTSDKINREIRSRSGINEGDVVFLQATRITERKAVETAIRLAAEFNIVSRSLTGKNLYNGKAFSGRVVLVYSGITERQSRNYRLRLDDLASNLGVEVIDIASCSSLTQQAFLESYSVADIVTYPTIFEGWGNQLLEALVSRKPVAIFRYSVFMSDIQDSGISFIDLGDQYGYKEGLVEIPAMNIKNAAIEISELLFDRERYREVTERNFELGREKFSFDTLSEIIQGLIADLS
ncbi:glycosyltransferase family 4 protein [Mesotoga sp. BH458_6_3_2_1]|uniref:glycosyltransferase family 4 protein n=1 Tax=Mesotoga sp. BH458_6_3_2_1 TaxID=1437446 RepID=UPI000EF1AB85|nr:glycosyltransferase family 4 protein [Mesotoga sp. BH458_6_3_2_1]RLL82948.1 glycosyl transferase group 1 [Mesotoga sp. BH458_6_3_2_1]